VAAASGRAGCKARPPDRPARHRPEDPEHRGVARLRRLQAAVDRAGLRQQAQALLARRFILPFDAVQGEVRPRFHSIGRPPVTGTMAPLM
jgi:hypothetical protein